MAQTTTSLGPRQGKGGPEKPHVPCLPPQRRGFPLTGWRSLDTAPFQQATAGPGAAARSTEHGLPSAAHTMEASGRAGRSAVGPRCQQSRSLAHRCSKAAPTALGPSPVLAQQAVLRFSLLHSLTVTMLSFPLRSSCSHLETKGSSCFSSTLLLWEPGQELNSRSPAYAERPPSY